MGIEMRAFIDLDNPEDVKYLYDWSVEAEKKIFTLLEVIKAIDNSFKESISKENHEIIQEIISGIQESHHD